MNRLSKLLLEREYCDPPSDVGDGGHGIGKKNRHYTQFGVTGTGGFMPNGTTVPVLEAGIYKIDQDMHGTPIFTPHRLESDKLLRFEDRRFQRVINEIADFWTDETKERYHETGLIHKRGMLLFGEPGTGKSALLKLVMEDSISKDTIVIIGREPRLLQEALSCLRQVEPDRPVLAVLEDVDEIAGYNEHAILNLFDGDSTVANVLYLGTTNYLDRLPARVLRAGRFDSKVEIGNPPATGRQAYFEMKFGKITTPEKIQNLVELTDNFSFAQLREFVVCFHAYRNPPEVAADMVRRGGFDVIGEIKEPDTEQRLVNLAIAKKLKEWNPNRGKILRKGTIRLVESLRRGR